MVSAKDPYLPRDFDEAELIGWEGYELFCGKCRALTLRRFADLRRKTPRRNIVDVASRLVCSKHRVRAERVSLHRQLKSSSGVLSGSVDLQIFPEFGEFEVSMLGGRPADKFQELIEQLHRGMRFRPGI